MGLARLCLGIAFRSAVMVLAAREARADDSTGRIARLEAELARQAEDAKRQAAETERLRHDFDAYRAAHPSADRPTSEEVQAAVDTYLAPTSARGVEVAPSAQRGLRWGGYLTTQFVAPSDENSHFDLNRLVFAADGSITDRIDLRTEVEFESGGVTGELDGEADVEQAEVVFRCCDALNPKLGAILIPFGRYNLYHEDPINDFTVRPFTATYLVPTGFGQPGIGAEGSVPFGRGHLFSYDVALTSGFRDNFNADEGVRDARQFWSGDKNAGKQAWGRAAVVWKTCALDYLDTGVSGTWARYDKADRNNLFGFGVDLLARKGPWELKGEYIAYDYERNALDPPGAVRGQSGLWLEAGYHFFPTSWCGCTSPFLTDTSLFTLCARYQHMNLDDQVRGATFHDDLDAWSVGLNLRVTERTVFRIDETWFDPVHGGTETEFTASFSTFF